MNINRNNYEEYFLLYADKELSADEKSMVETFVQQNPDLEEEFVMLQQSVIKPDNTITLEDKSPLFRNGEFINQDNYEEKFLLYTDNELNLSEIVETEKFVLSHPSLQNDFILLQKAKYEPDTTIVFPDKGMLYKKEEDGKVIPFRWKALAAAVILGIGLWTGVTYMQKNKIEPVIVKGPDVKQKSIPVKPVEEKNTTKEPIVIHEDRQVVPLQKQDKKEVDNLIKQPKQDVAIKTIQPVNTPEVTKLPEPKKEDVAIVKQPIRNEIPISNNLEKPDDPTRVIDKPAAPVVQTNKDAQYASYIADAEVKSDNYVFFNITTEEFKKSKIGNFLKKAKRVIENKIPFRGKGLKIGNVEIAKDIQN